MADPRVTRQFWIRAPGHGEIVTAELPPRQADQVLVRTKYSGISRGTEALVFRGEVPPSQHDSMRAPFQEGDFPGPVKYGYMSVGEVEEGPDELVGRMVFCLYPHQDLYCVPADAVALVPGDVPVTRAVLAAHMETAVNAVWDSGVTVGDRVAVIGVGVVGLLVAWLCRQIPGTRVTALDVNPARMSVAQTLDIDCEMASETHPAGAGECDLVFHASGRPEGLSHALGLAGPEGTIVELSWYGNRAVALPLGEDFHSRRLTIKSSQVGRLPASRQPRWNHRSRLRLALELLRDPALDVLLTGESDFADLPDVLTTLSDNPGDTLCHRVRYSTR